MSTWLRWAFLWVVLPPITIVAQEENEDYPPGLLARYAAGEKEVQRIDPDISFAWGHERPDPRLPDGPFEASWTAQLLIRSPGTHRFHAWTQGSVEVRLGDQVVLKGERGQPGWIDGAPVELPFGEQTLTATFRQTADTARIHLFWSSNEFPLEPLPSHLLFRETGSPELSGIERGRIEFESLRCGQCHQSQSTDRVAGAGPKGSPGPARAGASQGLQPRPPEGLLTAPSLSHVAVGTDPEWLVDKIHNPNGIASDGRMPHFGFTRDEARAIAAFLLSRSQPAKLDRLKPGKDPDKDAKAGRVLLTSQGCMACHRVGELGMNNPYGGGDLTTIGRKRSADWLYTWLAKPERLNPQHRMPVFKLSDKERQQLALALSRLGQESGEFETPKPDKGQIELGRQLVESARCAACHDIPDVAKPTPTIVDLAKSPRWDKSCLQEQPDQKTRRPAYPQADRDAIQAYVESWGGRLASESRFDRGRHLLERKNCLACHERDQTKGLANIAADLANSDDALAGQAPALIPPRLTAVGDKLPDEVLAIAISGEQKTIRMPWLKVRMPRFKHSDEERAAMLDYLIAHDRIPERAAEQSGSEPSDSRDAQRTLAAHELVGGKGFSCIACHQLGEYVPQVALGTRGSDLHLLGTRMRRGFFFRWTRSPLRVIPGVEMPSYTRPIPGVLDGTIDTQLAAIWDALNDPKLTVPSNPAVVEQYWTVPPGSPARIIRDVVTNPKENGGGYVSRAFAVGFANGHSVVLDLDTFALRQWAYGDFAKQRTQGKSWFWDLAGLPVMTGFEAKPTLVLRARHKSRGTAVPPGYDQENRRQAAGATQEVISPTIDGCSVGRVLGYEPFEDGVRLRYEMNFHLDGRPVALEVRETLRPVTPADDSKRSGWERRIEVHDVPDGYSVHLVPSNAKPVLGAPRMTFANARNNGQGDVELVRDSGSGSATIAVQYTAELQPESVPLKPAEATPVVPEAVMTLPGFTGVRLPLDRSIMPTGFAWTSDGTLAFTSLKGHVYLAEDSDGDGFEDRLTLFEEGLSAPFGLIADGSDLIVAHKPELLRLRDTDGDRRADHREVVASGWGFSHDYHDWTTGIVRDQQGRLYIGLGSDYAQKGRPVETCRYRGDILRIETDGTITPVAYGLRYPMGLAMTDDGEIYITDQQGVQNTFNEINRLVVGQHYGVPSLHEPNRDAPAMSASIQVPHPWTRSVNGLAVVPKTAEGVLRHFAGHLIGCEYDNRMLVRFSLQRVGDVVQGAAYPFSRPGSGNLNENFLGPIGIAISPRGDIYIGNMHDSGWQGGRNTGDITRLTPGNDLPNGLRELRATSDGFELEFLKPVDRSAAAKPENYSISGYTRVWEGNYATPDSGRHKADVIEAKVSRDGKTVSLRVNGLREGHVYEVTCDSITLEELWPATGHYTLLRRVEG